MNRDQRPTDICPLCGDLVHGTHSCQEPGLSGNAVLYDWQYLEHCPCDICEQERRVRAGDPDSHVWRMPSDEMLERLERMWRITV